MKHSNRTIAAVALSLALGASLAVLMKAAPAQAGYWGGSGGGSNCGGGCGSEPPSCNTCGTSGPAVNVRVPQFQIQPVPVTVNIPRVNVNTGCNDGCGTPPPPSNCGGCGDGGGKVNIDVNVNANASASASASASANAGGGASAASNVIVIGRGGGGGYYEAPAPILPMGQLDVVVREPQAEMKPVKGVCVSAKGLEEAARLSTYEREIGPQDDAELFHCVAGDMLVATIGRLAGNGNAPGTPDYIGGYVIECHEGEALRHGSNGLLACTPRQQRDMRTAPRSGSGKGYAEVMIRKGAKSSRSASAGGGAYYSGGVGY